MCARASDALSDWFPCPDTDTLSCAYFSIPLDYNDASAGNGQLLVVKANATGAEPKGTVFLNPGGPGVSGLQSLIDDTPALMNRTGGAYDFVSWDPRGVGPYTYPGNVYCIGDEEYDYFWAGTIEADGLNSLGDFSNFTDLTTLYAQVPLMTEKYAALGNKCLQGPNGTTLEYVGTAATVRDMVALADAIVGPDSEINYWGLSYGTYLGMVFANMFPERVGRVILDGVIDATKIATLQSHLLWRDQVASTEDVYSAFANACAMAGPSGCSLAFDGVSGADVVSLLSTVVEELHAHPSDARLRLMRGVMYGSMYQPQMWTAVANETIPQTIKVVLNGTELDDTFARRRSLAKRDTFTQNSFTQAAVVCADSVDADLEVTMSVLFDEIVEVTKNVSHTFGPLWPVPWFHCSTWPVRAVERYQGPFNGTFANKVLVIGNTYDGATPFYEAQATAEVLGDQATLVQQDGFGHTTLYQSSQCVTDIITAYLDDGTMPPGTAAMPTVCAIDESVELFPGVTDPWTSPQTARLPIGCDGHLGRSNSLTWTVDAFQS
ncbi:alpha/beta-hydrolase [Epithele typhae]|uniref:alpha/beta-hydrolase n=1 Tax=Epithele typhae TaxID=378194 RepID=UPI0020089A69|nr:alpha/beta-hydrolase [Epithele typhae]KAH9942522.1 alpha/beta-hydrolase [Epithele typhae]